MGDFILAIIGLSIEFGFYFIPTLAAGYLKHRQFEGILLLNVLLGWTFIGWLVAFFWAVLKD